MGKKNKPQWWINLCNKVFDNMNTFFLNGGMYVVFAVAFAAILFAIVGHYGTMGFNLTWFLCLELPLYIFCGWALYKAIKMWNNFQKERETYGKHENNSGNSNNQC